MDAKYNDPNPNNRRRTIFSGRPSVPLPLAQDPVADWLKLGDARSEKSSAGDVSTAMEFAQAIHTIGTFLRLLCCSGDESRHQPPLADPGPPLILRDSTCRGLAR